MPKPPKPPVTPAVRMLRAHKVDYTAHLYAYVPGGGAKASSGLLGVEAHQVVKTLVMEDEQQRPLVVLMHGDCSVNTGKLARELGHKRVKPCAPETAQKHSGYLVGGTSPFGLKRPMPVVVEESILELGRILVNGGKRGFLVEVSPKVLLELLEPRLVQVALSHEAGREEE